MLCVRSSLGTESTCTFGLGAGSSSLGCGPRPMARKGGGIGRPLPSLTRNVTDRQKVPRRLRPEVELCYLLVRNTSIGWNVDVTRKG